MIQYEIPYDVPDLEGPEFLFFSSPKITYRVGFTGFFAIILLTALIKVL